MKYWVTLCLMGWVSVTYASKKPAPVAPAATVQKAPAASKTPQLTERQKFSYSIGMNLGENFKEQAIDIDSEYVSRGIKDVLDGKPTLLNQDESLAIMQQFQEKMIKERAKAADALGKQNQAEGTKFLEANKKKKGVVTLDSGLQYEVITQGKGAKPKATDEVVTNYRGMLLNGTEFDSSYSEGQPASFPVNAVIPGWTEALQLMTVGSKWKLYIPSDLAYGEQGVGDIIGPHATLVFEIELLEIKAP